MSLNPLQLALDCLLLLLFYYAWKAMSYQACLVAFFIWIIAALFVALLCVMPDLLNSLDEDETELVAPEHLMIVRVMAAAGLGGRRPSIRLVAISRVHLRNCVEEKAVTVARY